MSKYKIKLQPGDYCRRDMGDDKYREVAQRFFEDGCPPLPEKCIEPKNQTYFGWGNNCGKMWKEGTHQFYHAYKDAFTGRLLTYEAVMELADNSDWYERGELPPVGIECMQGDSTVRIVAHISNGNYKYAVFQGVNGDVCGYSDSTYFNPLKSDRDRAIEAAKEVLKTDGSKYQEGSLGALYDAGLLRLPEGK